MRRIVGLAAALLAAAPVQAQDAPLKGMWRTIAETDSAAALKLVEDNHPGAAPELGDAGFQKLLATARTHLAERLPKVDGVAAYMALMAGLATDFRDGHIWFHPTLNWAARNWAGLLIVRRGGKWVVGGQEAAAGEPPLKDAELIDCDGIPADTLAKQRLGLFAARPDIEASMAKRAWMLLIDDSNPYLTRPATCRFANAGSVPEAVVLNWRPIQQSRLTPLVNEASPRINAGMGVSSFAGGQWIALESLGSRAPAVVKEVEEKTDALRAAPIVVLDMRGNGGGDSSFGDAIAKVLVGERRFLAAMPESSCDGAYWRATPVSLKTLRDVVESVRARGDTEQAAMWAQQAAATEQAIAAGQAFAPALPACAAKASAALSGSKASKLPPTLMQGRLVLLTDRSCFSSCLTVAETFRLLGALHVGEATDISTRYMEVVEIPLPSGLGMVSTLQKVAVGHGDFGPYVPERPYPGDLRDTDALKAWIAQLR